MATLTFVGKDNGESGARVPAKDGRQVLDGKSQVLTHRSFVKMASVLLALAEAHRQALGTVHRTREKPGKTNSSLLKQQQPTFPGKQISEKLKASLLIPSTEAEGLFPSSLTDAEISMDRT